MVHGLPSVTVPPGSGSASGSAVRLRFRGPGGSLWVGGGMPAAAFPGDPGVSLQITIPRGSDGFGFTICCDSPVRVQAVDSGKIIFILLDFSE